MGYDTYNAFEGDFDGKLAIEQGRLMKKYGLVDSGYNVRVAMYLTCLIPSTHIADIYS